MSPPESSEFLHRLSPEVTAFTRTPFSLKDDLERLDKVARARAPEAAILYCSRILEALTGAALDAAGLPSVMQVAADLDTLHAFSLTPTATHYWAHSLRRAGNDARHIRRRLEPGDADLALVFLDRWLHWFFCHFRRPAVLLHLTTDARSLWSVHPELHGWVLALEAAGFPAPEVLTLAAAGGASPVWLHSPALPAALAERLLDHNRSGDAWHVIEAALHKFPRDLRLHQLKGLYLSRTGRPKEAVAVLEPLREWNVRDPEDFETHGLLGGAYKRLWIGEGHDHWLEKCHRAYASGWKNVRDTNPYLGINAASTALWLDRGTESRQHATQVRQLLRDREAALARRGDPSWVLGYWDQVTLAEAELLLGNLPAARDLYARAFAQHARDQGSIAVTREQALRNLKAMGLGHEASAFFP